MSETDLVRAILKYLKVCGVCCWRQNTGAVRFNRGAGKGSSFVRFGEPGISDILGITWSGKFLAIEVKLPGKKPTGNQKEFLRKIDAFGGVAFVATSLEDIKEKLGIIREVK